MSNYRQQLDEWKTLKELTRLRLREQFTKANRPAGTGNENNAFVLVLDATTQPIVSAVFGRYELVEIGCASIVRLDIPDSRAPQAALDAIYFISPTKDNLNAICKDFEMLARDFNRCFCDCGPQHKVTVNVKAFMYNEVHVFTTDALTPDKINILKSSAGLKGQIKTLKQLSLNYSPVEENVFTFNMANDLQTLFESASVTNQNKSQDMITDIAKRLVTLCVTLDEKPLVRYCAKSSVCHRIAEEFHGQMQSFLTKYGWDRDRNPNGFHPQRGWRYVELAGTVLIVDRVEDLMAPILHNFAYQCAVQDILEIKKGLEYSYTNSKGKTIRRLLDSSDKLFQQIKYLHLTKAVELIVAKGKELGSQSGGASKDGPSLDDLQQRLKTFEDKSRGAAEVQDHTQMAQELLAKIKEAGLKQLAALEQVFATNMDATGAEYTYHKVRDQIRECLQSPNLSALDKARLLVLFQVTAKQAEQRKYLRELAKLANFPTHSNLFKGLLNQPKMLGQNKTPVSAIHVDGNVNPRLRSEMKAKTLAAPTDMRYEPKVKSLVESHIAGTLDTDAYPYHGAPAMHGFADKNNLYGPRVIVFIAGGASHSEVRVLNMILNNQILSVEKALAADAQFTSGSDQIRSSKVETIREVILGSTSIVSPEIYMAKLCTADREEEVNNEMLLDVLEFEKAAPEDEE